MKRKWFAFFPVFCAKLFGFVPAGAQKRMKAIWCNRLPATPCKIMEFLAVSYFGTDFWVIVLLGQRPLGQIYYKRDVWAKTFGAILSSPLKSLQTSLLQ